MSSFQYEPGALNPNTTPELSQEKKIKEIARAIPATHCLLHLLKIPLYRAFITFPSLGVASLTAVARSFLRSVLAHFCPGRSIAEYIRAAVIP